VGRHCGRMQRSEKAATVVRTRERSQRPAGRGRDRRSQEVGRKDGNRGRGETVVAGTLQQSIVEVSGNVSRTMLRRHTRRLLEKWYLSLADAHGRHSVTEYWLRGSRTDLLQLARSQCVQCLAKCFEMKELALNQRVGGSSPPGSPKFLPSDTFPSLAEPLRRIVCNVSASYCR
jgi:hypothetical protein